MSSHQQLYVGPYIECTRRQVVRKVRVDACSNKKAK